MDIESERSEFIFSTIGVPMSCDFSCEFLRETCTRLWKETEEHNSPTPSPSSTHSTISSYSPPLSSPLILLLPPFSSLPHSPHSPPQLPNTVPTRMQLVSCIFPQRCPELETASLSRDATGQVHQTLASAGRNRRVLLPWLTRNYVVNLLIY